MMDVAEGEEQTTALLTARVLTLNFGGIHVSTGNYLDNDWHLIQQCCRQPLK